MKSRLVQPFFHKLQKKIFLKSGLYALLLIYLTACGAVTPVPSPTSTSTITPLPTATATVTPTSTPTATPTKVFAWTVRRNNDCFVATGFDPGKATKEDVRALWGEPSFIEFPETDYELWNYDSVGSSYMWFDGNIVESVHFFLERCTLGDIIVTLGSPELVELVTLHYCTSADVSYHITFHYPNRGFAYTYLCPWGSTEEECLSFHPDDELGVKEFYKIGKKVKDTIGFNMSFTFFEWTGFDQ